METSVYKITGIYTLFAIENAFFFFFPGLFCVAILN